MRWGTKQSFGSRAEVDGYVADLQVSFPKVKSAYVPSGKTPPGALLALAAGSAAGVPSGGLAGAATGGLTIALVVLLGLVIAFARRICCIAIVLEVGIAVIGFALTFAVPGFVAGWMTGYAGRLGKNRSPTAAALFALPSTLAAFGLLAITPQIAAALIDPPLTGEDLSFGTLVYLVAGTSWVHLVLWCVGLAIALCAAWISATAEVASQKFCEPCDCYMEKTPVHAMSFQLARWAFPLITSGQSHEVPGALRPGHDPDVEADVFGCPQCSRGFFEARAHVAAEYPGRKRTEHHTTSWLCFSRAIEPEQTRLLAQCKRTES